MWRRRLVVATFALLVVAAASACGGSPTTTYTNGQYGFSLTYDANRFQQGKPAPLTQEKSRLFQISFRDVEAGLLREGTETDKAAEVGVTVYQGNGTQPTAGQMAMIARQWNSSAPNIGPSGARFGRYRVSTFAGRPCLVISGSFDDKGVKVMTQDYFLFTAKYWYGVHLQSAERTWKPEQPVLLGVAESIRLTP